MNALYEWINAWMNEWMHECMHAWINAWMNAWMNECMNAWMNEWMNEVLIGLKKDILHISNVCATDRPTNRPTCPLIEERGRTWTLTLAWAGAAPLVVLALLVASLLVAALSAAPPAEASSTFPPSSPLVWRCLLANCSRWENNYKVVKWQNEHTCWPITRDERTTILQ